MPEFDCHVCRTRLSVEQGQAGALVRCPTCRTIQRAPAQTGQSATPVTPIPERRAERGAAGGGEAAAPAVGPLRQAMPGLPAASGRRYGFVCPYCSSPLEAHESMAAREGQCPTCGNTITIPILDRYNRLIDPITQEIIRQDPHPVHAYAAAGHHAPKILRGAGGGQQIQCPRCAMVNSISANNCAGCGMPFTMEGTTVDATVSSNGYCVSSLVLGIVSLPSFCTVIPALLAIGLGIVGLTQLSKANVRGVGGGRGMAIAGISLGAISCLIALAYFR